MHHEQTRAPETEYAVVIAGGGPTGLMLAAELALAGVAVAIVERRANQDVAGSRAGGLHARTLELLDQRGVAERFLAQGQTMQIAQVAGVVCDISAFPTRHPYGLALVQRHIERTLADWAAELGVHTLRGLDVVDFAQDDAGVTVGLSHGHALRAQYLVGCDGGRSLVRKHAGIAFDGWDASTSYLIAEADVVDEPAWGMRRSERGVNGIGKLDDGKRMRIVLSEPEVRHGEPDVAELRAALYALYGTDFGIRGASWMSRFSDMARQAVAYRSGRVLLAGDAAHVHSPVGGQGLNTGVHDAVNLGWKLAQVVRGHAPDALLDSYHSERHPVGARVLKTTLALTALERGDARSEALREHVAELLSMEEPRAHYAAKLTGLDIRYDLGDGHPLVGRRMPDLDIACDEGPSRVYALLRDARPVLLELGVADALETSHARVKRVHARCEGPWRLPVVGDVTAPRAVLIRPDGHVAWVDDGTRSGLTEALTRWFGPAA